MSTERRRPREDEDHFHFINGEAILTLERCLVTVEVTRAMLTSTTQPVSCRLKQAIAITLTRHRLPFKDTDGMALKKLEGVSSWFLVRLVIT